jgi:hypothetical protein
MVLKQLPFGFSNERDKMKQQKVYPIQLTEVEKQGLVSRIPEWIQELRQLGPSGIRDLHWLDPVLEKIAQCKGEDRDKYEKVIREAHKLLAKENPFVMVAVSARRHLIMKIDPNLSHYNPSFGISGGEGMPDQMMPMTSAKMVTKSMPYGDAMKVYSHLSLGMELPEGLSKWIIKEDEDDE